MINKVPNNLHQKRARRVLDSQQVACVCGGVTNVRALVLLRSSAVSDKRTVTIGVIQGIGTLLNVKSLGIKKAVCGRITHGCALH